MALPSSARPSPCGGVRDGLSSCVPRTYGENVSSFQVGVAAVCEREQAVARVSVECLQRGALNRLSVRKYGRNRSPRRVGPGGLRRAEREHRSPLIGADGFGRVRRPEHLDDASACIEGLPSLEPA